MIISIYNDIFSSIITINGIEYTSNTYNINELVRLKTNKFHYQTRIKNRCAIQYLALNNKTFTFDINIFLSSVQKYNSLCCYKSNSLVNIYNEYYKKPIVMMYQRMAIYSSKKHLSNKLIYKFNI